MLYSEVTSLQVSQEGIGAFDFSAETMNKLTAPLAADVAAPVAADLAVPLSGPAAVMQPASRAIQQPGGGGVGGSSGVQVFAAVAKDAGEQELWQLFGSVPGLEQCKLLPHQHTGMFEVRFLLTRRCFVFTQQCCSMDNTKASLISASVATKKGNVC